MPSGHILPEDAAAPAAAAACNARRVHAAPPRLSSAQILGEGAEVEIDHRGALYRLRLTSLGKLILTK